MRKQNRRAMRGQREVAPVAVRSEPQSPLQRMSNISTDALNEVSTAHDDLKRAKSAMNNLAYSAAETVLNMLDPEESSPEIRSRARTIMIKFLSERHAALATKFFLEVRRLRFLEEMESRQMRLTSIEPDAISDAVREAAARVEPGLAPAKSHGSVAKFRIGEKVKAVLAPEFWGRVTSIIDGPPRRYRVSHLVESDTTGTFQEDSLRWYFEPGDPVFVRNFYGSGEHMHGIVFTSSDNFVEVQSGITGNGEIHTVGLAHCEPDRTVA